MLAGKVAIVTGGCTGIGLGITRALAAEGAQVMVAQLDVSGVDAEARGIPNTHLWETDVTDPGALRALIQQTLSLHGRLDILVNNAALTGLKAAAPFLEFEAELVRRILAVNFEAPFHLSRLAAGEMVRSGAGGSIIHISSVGAWAAQEHASVYCATKAALVSLAQTMALELAPHGIRVNAVLPGDIRTRSSENIAAQLEASGSSGRYMRSTPLGRRGTPDDVAQTVVFLSSDRASFLTGAAIPVDGGWTIY